MEMDVDSDCSDSDGHGNDNNQEAIVIPITKRNDPTPAEGFRTDKNEMIYNSLYLYVLRLKIRLDRHLFLRVRCLVVNDASVFKFLNLLDNGIALFVSMLVLTNKG